MTGAAIGNSCDKLAFLSGVVGAGIWARLGWNRPLFYCASFAIAGAGLARFKGQNGSKVIPLASLRLGAGLFAGSGFVLLVTAHRHVRTFLRRRNLYSLILAGRDACSAIGYSGAFSPSMLQFANRFSRGESRALEIQRNCQDLFGALGDGDAFENERYRVAILTRSERLFYSAHGLGHDSTLFNSEVRDPLLSLREQYIAIWDWVDQMAPSIDGERVVWADTEAQAKFNALICSTPLDENGSEVTISLKSLADQALLAHRMRKDPSGVGEGCKLAVRSFFESMVHLSESLTMERFTVLQKAINETFPKRNQTSKEECGKIAKEYDEMMRGVEQMRRLIHRLPKAWDNDGVLESEHAAAWKAREQFQALKLRNKLCLLLQKVRSLKGRARTAAVVEDEDDEIDHSNEIYNILAGARFKQADYDYICRELGIAYDDLILRFVERDLITRHAFVDRKILKEEESTLKAGSDQDYNEQRARRSREIADAIVSELRYGYRDRMRRRLALLAQTTTQEVSKAGSGVSKIGRLGAWGWCLTSVGLAIAPAFVDPVLYLLGAAIGLLFPLEPDQLPEELGKWRRALPEGALVDLALSNRFLSMTPFGLEGMRLNPSVTGVGLFQRAGQMADRPLLVQARHFANSFDMTAALVDFESLGSAWQGARVGWLLRNQLGITTSWTSLMQMVG